MQSDSGDVAGSSSEGTNPSMHNRKLVDDRIAGIQAVFNSTSKLSAFTCSGSIKWPHPIDIYYKTKGEGVDFTCTRIPASAASLGCCELWES
jgi:hypothetical protein